jgi:hypothetical protein
MGLRDLLGQVKSGITGGPTPPGSWGDQEKFGRFEGTGEVSAELTLPAGPLTISIEDYLTVQDLDVRLTGPAGDPVGLKHYSEAPDDDTTHSLKNLRAVASAEIEAPGLYRLTLRAPNSEEPLLILAGS